MDDKDATGCKDRTVPTTMNVSGSAPPGSRNSYMPESAGQAEGEETRKRAASASAIERW
jgi:hypothetical protein